MTKPKKIEKKTYPINARVTDDTGKKLEAICKNLNSDKTDAITTAINAYKLPKIKPE